MMTPLNARILYIGLLASLFSGCAPPAASGPLLRTEAASLLPAPGGEPVHVRVVTFNVHYGSDVPRLARSIRENPALRTADVILLQEIRSYPEEGLSRTQRLAEALQMNYVYAPARPTADGGTHGLALLSRYPILEHEVLPLLPFRLGGTAEPRIALMVNLDVGGRPLRIYNVHLDTRLNKGERIAQLRGVVETASERRPDGPVIIGGDFNTNPFWWLGHVVPLFYSGQAQALDEFVRHSGFATPVAKSGSTIRTNLLRMRLDTFYTEGLLVTAYGVERKVDTSDHVPVWMDVRWGR